MPQSSPVAPPTGKPNVNPPPSAPRIAVIGDIMIDVDLHCSCTRLCQEGPWPVFLIDRTQRRLGGAGNVAEMTSVLGATTLLLGLVGKDFGMPSVAWDSIPSLFHSPVAWDEKDLGMESRATAGGKDLGMESRATEDAIVPGWQVVEGQTTTKTRYWVDGRLTGPRIDHDLGVGTELKDVQLFLERLREFRPDAIIVADHGKGVVTRELLESCALLDVPIFVDPIQATPLSRSGRYAAIAGARHELSRDARSTAECVIEKRGADGLVWSVAECGQGLRADGQATKRMRLPPACRNLVDPLGAGDQFIAALAFQRCRGVDWERAIAWANVAAGLQCERRGCEPVTEQQIVGRLNQASAELGARSNEQRTKHEQIA